MRLKLLLPYDRFILTTSLSEAEVHNRLAQYIEPGKILPYRIWPSKSPKPYEGRLVGNRFKISRIISGRNSFQPVIAGTFHAEDAQTIVAITMRPAITALIFTGVWLCAVGSSFLLLLISTIIGAFKYGKYDLAPPSIASAGMFAFGYGLLMLCYRPEAKKSKLFLMQILHGLN